MCKPLACFASLEDVQDPPGSSPGQPCCWASSRGAEAAHRQCGEEWATDVTGEAAVTAPMYEAGKAAKAGYPPSVSGVPGPYSIPSVPLGGAPSSGMLMDKPHPPPLAPSDSTGGSHSVRKGYRIQADKERDSMKVLYYVEKELAQFDPARRMRGRYNNTISELSSLHEDDSNFCQSYHQMRSKQFPVSGDLESNPDYWPGVMGGSSGASRGPSAMEYNKEDHESFRHSQQRSKSEMLARKNFAAGVPAVSMDELAAFADSYGQRTRRAEGNSHEARGGGRFERSEARAPGGFYQDGSLEEYYGPRSRSREPLTDAERAWGYSPPRRRPPEDAPLPRLVSRTPGAAPKYDHAYRSGALERQARPEGASRGGSLETPSKRSAQLGPRSASYYAWSPTATYEAGAPRADEEDAPDDALPPYSERELSRGPSYRSRELPYHGNSEKRRQEPAKKTKNEITELRELGRNFQLMSGLWCTIHTSCCGAVNVVVIPKGSDFPTRMSLVV
ncbi:hypothetical protein HPG69_005371 [Diceros bicornis minor]|uniref:Uncharacterized protein n=1 Tax=Diceros bicornis minor TaxID=77932 RepID=A0A7J7EMB5_DICBM|nr:hypothetical protein HPG69_005371 [Diceros bicornis minor]